MKKTNSLFSMLKRINLLALEDTRVKKLVIFSTVLTAIVAFFPAITGYVMSQIVNQLQTAAVLHEIKDVKNFSIFYLVLILAPFVLKSFNTRITNQVSSVLNQNFNFVFKGKMSNLNHAYFDDPKFHDVIKNVKEKGVSATHALFTLQFTSLEAVIGLVSSTVVVSFLGLKYTGVLVLSVLPILGVEIWKRKKRKVLSDNNRSDSRHANVYGDAAGAKETRIFNLNEKYLGRWKSITDNILDRTMRFENRRVLIDIATWFIFGIGLGYVTYQIFFLIATGIFLIGTGTFVLSSVWGFTMAVREIIYTMATLYENSMYAEEFFVILNLPDIIDSKNKERTIFFSKAPAIVFDGVSFRYPGKEKLALDNISFQISPDQKIALVGENGGGKSTIIKLMLRLYDPVSGRILIDGEDLRNMNLEKWRNIIGYVAQGPSIPNLKIRDILTHEDAVSEELMIQSAKRSRAHEFISGYKNSYDQRLGKMFDGGISPSDGQRQRLAISRAYSIKPKLLIFDEPTADLDPETQEYVFEDFYKENKGVTGIMVAHSLQGVIPADCIYVFERGCITQKGGHKILLDTDGWYKRSFEKQFKYFQIPV